MVRRTQGGSKLEQRQSRWAALALLRCVSSSPAAAASALRTRLQALGGEPEDRVVAALEQRANEAVLDGSAEDALSLDETVPAGTIEAPEDAPALRALIERAEGLRGPEHDPKLAALVREVRALLADGFKPVVFCRYIATAHYVADQLRSCLDCQKTHVFSVTGELPSEQREERIEELASLADEVRPVLVATDCLSEGINLQRFFDAVIHYDLSWNPTRHEQREGRVDRFGQSARQVRTVMLYGDDNPVDQAVLRVILRKAQKIRKELGVPVPLPADCADLVDAIMQEVLRTPRQGSLDFGETEREVDAAWRSAREQMTRTVFAQRRLRPEEVLPEWRKAVAVLGGAADVARFVTSAAERLGAPLDRRDDHFRLPIAHLPAPLRERLAAAGLEGTLELAFEHPLPSGVVHVHRAHPLVATLAEYIAERALEEEDPSLAARCGALFTTGVPARTTVFLLRLRYQIAVERRDGDGSSRSLQTLLAEECSGLAVRGTAEPQVLDEADALALLSLAPGRNMPDGQKAHLVKQALDALPTLEREFEAIAERRAGELLEDHRRVRAASDARGLRYAVNPALPVDVMGVWVLVPMVTA